jgi:hypothetical protein
MLIRGLIRSWVGQSEEPLGVQQHVIRDRLYTIRQGILFQQTLAELGGPGCVCAIDAV